MEQGGADIAIRREAFIWLESQVRIYGEVLPRSVLEQGLHFQGNQIRLVGPQGIFKPRPTWISYIDYNGSFRALQR